MFKGTKYVTKGVQSEIPSELQFFMWNCILALPEPVDYLQIFRLYYSEGKQKIIHEQEQPEYKRKHILNFSDPVTAKVSLIVIRERKFSRYFPSLFILQGREILSTFSLSLNL